MIFLSALDNKNKINPHFILEEYSTFRYTPCLHLHMIAGSGWAAKFQIIHSPNTHRNCPLSSHYHFNNVPNTTASTLVIFCGVETPPWIVTFSDNVVKFMTMNLHKCGLFYRLGL